MSTYLTLFALLVLSLMNARAQDTLSSGHPVLPSPGTPAPPIVVARWMNTDDTTMTIPEGRPILLEFWATWCSPCVKAIPHMNELRRSAPDSAIVFVSLTDEPPLVIERFLKRHRMAGHVAIDDGRKTYTGYGVDAIPEAFLIDTAGVIRWHGHPTELTGEDLRKFLEEDIAPYTWEF